MAPAKIRVIIVGAGIVGASLAFHFARRGTEVHMVEEGVAAGSGVTSSAFGWVNIINIAPGAINYGLVQEALVEYARLQADLPGVFVAARAGSLFWLASPAETEAFAAAHRTAGTDVELVDAATIAAWEPNLLKPPACAIFSPLDLALDPARLARDLIDAAGITATFGRKVGSLTLSGNIVTGVRFDDGGVIEADLVILTAGTAVDRLAENLGFRTGVEASPSIILRYSCTEPVLSRILRGPGLEIRQSADNRLNVAKGYIDDREENAPESVGRRILKIMHERLRLPERVSLVEAVAGYRPFFSDGMPRLGFLPGVEGAYAAVGHPGVILAPLLGRLAAEHVLEGRRSPLIPPAGLM
ncbi:glycine/D-amino acid oxidase-like deaminating enzyme [Rhizobium sp. BK529]|uniref:NAD(P)/FAD-dependent oxidoreductase n=1 Tax=unclassified Rhizobium TaxID=2613769 RepID=UPI00104C50B9|nr:MULTISPECIES: FAD-dependent oxidoreductase [unclassified Rhizobium]MBB3592048.1 glycine/D-amino acid oxidase-like deaminating enzyme [Rhizobium sp. BK529]TCS06471.1 glycine/D-amino acid oxidase-like deaminating enzyme [Rhizobium sp. BK418]